MDIRENINRWINKLKHNWKTRNFRWHVCKYDKNFWANESLKAWIHDCNYVKKFFTDNEEVLDDLEDMIAFAEDCSNVTDSLCKRILTNTYIIKLEYYKLNGLGLINRIS